MNTKEAREFINFAEGFRVAAYGTPSIHIVNQEFQAGKDAGRLLHPDPITAEIVIAAYEKWKVNG